LLDKTNGLYLNDFGARQYDAQLARWTRLDPSAEKYKNMSPYVFTVDNPAKNIDPDGRDVHVFGLDELNFVAALRGNTTLNVVFNNYTNQLTFSGTPITPVDFVLLTASMNNDVHVNMITTEATEFRGGDGRVAGLNIGGFAGNKVDQDGQIQTTQYFNYSQSVTVQAAGMSNTGQDAAHELMESYFGGIFDVGDQGPANSVLNPKWDYIHNLAMSMDPDAPRIFYNADDNILKDYSSSGACINMTDFNQPQPALGNFDDGFRTAFGQSIDITNQMEENYMSNYSSIDWSMF